MRELRAVRSFVDVLDRVLGMGVQVQGDVPLPATVAVWRRLASGHGPPRSGDQPEPPGAAARGRGDAGGDTKSLQDDGGGRRLREARAEDYRA